MKNPKVSVILPIYKEKKIWIQKAIDSILNQTFRDIELIVINDNPSSEINESIIEDSKKKDARVKSITNSQNLGLPQSLNIGIEASSGSYIARMDADDIAHRERLGIQFAYMENNPEVGICGTGGLYIDEDDKIIGKMNIEGKDSLIKGRLLFSTTFIHPSVMIRRDLILNCKYNPACRCTQDIELWVRLAHLTDFHNINENLMFYRVHKSKAQEREGKKNANIALRIVAPQCADYWKIDGYYKILYVDYYCNEPMSQMKKDELFSYLAKKDNLKIHYQELVKRYLKDLLKNKKYHKIFFNPLMYASPVKCMKSYIHFLVNAANYRYS